MLLTEVMPQIRQAFKANIKPGAILWALMLIFFAAYATSATFSSGLGKVSELKTSVGYPFSFGVYVLFAAIMPEMFKIMFFQKWRPTVQNLRNLVFVGLLFGCIGIVTDIFYLYQARWFGEAGDLRTLLLKAFVDQALYSPVANFILVSIFFMRENGIRRETLKKIVSPRFVFTKVLPVVVAGWCIWIPGVMLVYSMPTALQLPVASLILCFWVLIFTFVTASRAEPAKADNK